MKNWAKRAVWGIGLAVCVGCVIAIMKFAGKTENKTITNNVEIVNTEEVAGIEATETVSGTESGDTASPGFQTACMKRALGR